MTPRDESFQERWTAAQHYAKYAAGDKSEYDDDELIKVSNAHEQGDMKKLKTLVKRSDKTQKTNDEEKQGTGHVKKDKEHPDRVPRNGDTKEGKGNSKDKQGKKVAKKVEDSEEKEKKNGKSDQENDEEKNKTPRAE
ncbi:hypothetical protein BV898_05186 [Hypsibius exemplaris]|uniref:Uncharacterized protein n=1 Tax=Hypsibius exemplaris TaxID=2072580 RepID=A0A1W0X0M5_HYPEX|nr:hypothetical protein BV898_05186 [Hypsibius exemplaris]